MKLRKLEQNFTVCKVADMSGVDFADEFVFFAKTDDELSLVCASEKMPANATEIEHDWNAFKIEGVLDFSLIGIIAKISNILAEARISLFVVSTFNTDYVLLKSDKFEEALTLLAANGYEIG